MTVAAYVRVSHRRQNTDGQEAEIRKWAAGNGIDPDKMTTWEAVEAIGLAVDRGREFLVGGHGVLVHGAGVGRSSGSVWFPASRSASS